MTAAKDTKNHPMKLDKPLGTPPVIQEVAIDEEGKGQKEDRAGEISPTFVLETQEINGGGDSYTGQAIHDKPPTNILEGSDAHGDKGGNEANKSKSWKEV